MTTADSKTLVFGSNNEVFNFGRATKSVAITGCSYGWVPLYAMLTTTDHLKGLSKQPLHFNHTTYSPVSRPTKVVSFSGNLEKPDCALNPLV